MDDEHKEIFQSLSTLQTTLSSQSPAADVCNSAQSLLARIEDHFAHEERIMRAVRYGSFQWHKKKHDGARRRAAEFVNAIELGDSGSGAALVKYLSSWLQAHTRLADAMLAAFLRNHQRSLYKVTFRAGTKPADACPWFDSRGERFDPLANNTGC